MQIKFDATGRQSGWVIDMNKNQKNTVSDLHPMKPAD